MNSSIADWFDWVVEMALTGLPFPVGAFKELVDNTPLVPDSETVTNVIWFLMGVSPEECNHPQAVIIFRIVMKRMAALGLESKLLKREDFREVCDSIFGENHLPNKNRHAF